MKKELKDLFGQNGRKKAPVLRHASPGARPSGIDLILFSGLKEPGTSPVLDSDGRLVGATCSDSGIIIVGQSH